MGKPIKTCNQRVISKISLELGVSEQQVKEITDFQASFTTGIIREGRFEGVMWPYLGKFRADPKSVQNYNNKKGAIKNKQIEKPTV